MSKDTPESRGNEPPLSMVANLPTDMHWVSTHRDAVRAWLSRYVRMEATRCLLLAFGGLLLAVLLTAATWLLLFALSLSRTRYATSPLFWEARAFFVTVLMATALAVRLGRWLWARSGRAKCEDVSSGGNKIEEDGCAVGVLDSFLLVLCYGPDLAARAFRALIRAARVLRIRCDDCAEGLAMLAADPDRVSYQDFDTACRGNRSEFDEQELVRQLLLVRGVVPLESRPPGLTLTDDLRKELRALR